MGDELDYETFDTLVQASFVLESLKDTLDQMVEGYYIRKDTSDQIIAEASKQLRLILDSNSYGFPKNYMFGQLAHYKYSQNLWVFNIKNPLIFIYSTSDRAPGDQEFELGDLFIPRARSTLSKDVRKHLNQNNSKMLCLEGYVKIMAVAYPDE